VTLSPGLVAAGAGRHTGVPPELLLQQEDVADAVLWVIGTHRTCAWVEIGLPPQRTP
jgi:hypothetical protein